MVNFHNGNLFESNSECLVNTVNCVGVMGKGIALEFKRRFPEMFESYKLACKNREIKTGTMWVWDRMNGDKREIIINFPTKNDWKNPSELEWIKTGLIDFIYVLGKYDIKSVAIPALGCSNGGLDWNAVKRIMHGMLTPVSEKVEINIFNPY